MTTESDDVRYMQRALDEAARGRWTARPNPMVGCVLVRDGEIVGVGHHVRAGEPHAEVNALRDAGDRAKGATAYVNLEPCSHHGRTPPCTDALLDAGVARVVAGMIDPNPRVSGQGLARLRDHGVQTTVGVLEAESRALNADFVTRMTLGRPRVTVKLAQSLDGRIATRTGDSRWISGAASRRRVHLERADSDAILVGTRTLLLDDPRLNTRLDDHPDAPSPHRWVLDPTLAVPDSAAVLDTSVAATTIVTGPRADAERRAVLESRGVQVVAVDAVGTHLDLAGVLRAMAERGHQRLLVEGGGELAAGLLEQGLVDRMLLFVAPVIIGGRDAVPSVGGVGADTVAEAIRARRIEATQIGDDVLLDVTLGDVAD